QHISQPVLESSADRKSFTKKSVPAVVRNDGDIATKTLDRFWIAPRTEIQQTRKNIRDALCGQLVDVVPQLACRRRREFSTEDLYEERPRLLFEPLGQQAVGR